MASESNDIKAYYDDHALRKLRLFVQGNPRIDRAWQTITEWAPDQPARILEIGCGIGEIAWRMARTWPGAQVVGLDPSGRSIELARTVFKEGNLSFVEGFFASGVVSGPFDLIVLVDVYEHIAAGDRADFHAALAEVLAPHGRLILTCPTPRHQSFLRREKPHMLQPVDEDISAATICALADAMQRDVQFFVQVSVWHRGDYLHAVVGQEPWTRVLRQRRPGLRRRLRHWWEARSTFRPPDRAQRIEMVKAAMGDRGAAQLIESDTAPPSHRQD